MNLENFNKKESLSTAGFLKELDNIDFAKEGPRIRKFSVELDPNELERLINENSSLSMVESSDGFISNVRETPNANPLDHSKSSGYFLMHTDGQYLPKVPEMVVLHCVDPGTSEMPTVFLDTQDILDILKKNNKLDEAQEYQFVFKNKKGIEFRRPLIEGHPITKEPLMNIAIASPQCRLEVLPTSSKTQENADEFYKMIGETVEKELKYTPYTWKKNDTIVFDNLRLVHGRGMSENSNPSSVDNQRHLYRIWLNHKENV